MPSGRRPALVHVLREESSKKITGLGRIVAASAIVVAMTMAPSVQAASPENAVDAADVSTGYVNLAYGDHTVNAALGAATDVDSYHFTAEAGDQVRLLLHTQTGWLDASAVPRGPSGAVVNSTSCVGNHNGVWGVPCSATFDQTIVTSGTYTINFSDSGANNAGNYELDLEQYPPTNNWTGFAYGTPANVDSLDYATDMDFFAFQGPPGLGPGLRSPRTAAVSIPMSRFGILPGHRSRRLAVAALDVPPRRMWISA